MDNKINHQHTRFDVDYIDLRLLIQGLKDKIPLILTISLIFFALAVTVALLAPTKYQSSVLLKIQHKPHHLMANTPAAGQHLSIPNNSDEPLAVQIALIQSEFILRPVIKSLGLDIDITPDNGSFLNYFLMKPSGFIRVNELNLPANYMNTTFRLTTDSQHEYRFYDPDNKLLLHGETGRLAAASNAIAINVDKIDAPAGSQFAIKKLHEYEILAKIHKNLSIADLSGTNESNGNKAAILRISLIGKDPVLVTKILNQIAVITKQQNMKIKAQEAEQNLLFLNMQLPIIKASLKEAEEKLNVYRAENGRVDTKLQTEYLLNHISEVNQQLGKVRLKNIDLLQKYTSNHPFVIALNKEFNELEKRRNELTSQLKKFPASEQGATNLKREVDVKNKLYMLLLSQIHQLEVIKTGITSDVQILSYASTPYIFQPVKISVIGFFGLLTGLMTGCVIVLISRILIRKIDDAHWVENTWNIKNLAIVPYSSNQQNHSGLLACSASGDIAIESLCNIRAFIQLTLTHSASNIISIMGISNGIGKTFITANLACLLARTGKKVLIIDADIRSGHMNQFFKAPSEPGLSDLINGKCKINEAIIQPKEIPHLHFLSSGAHSENASDLLMCDEFKSLILSLSKNYEYVFINTPSRQFNTDNLLICSLSNINLLVLGEHAHESSEIDMVIKNFNHTNIRIDGYIFNQYKKSKRNRYSSPLKLLKFEY